MQIAIRISLALMFLFSVPSAFGSDVEDMKTAFLDAMDKLREKDLDGFLTYWHPEAVFLARDRLFAIDRAASEYDEWAAEVDRFFAQTVSAEMVPIDVSYRVLGDTGIIWGRARFSVDPRGGGGSDFDSRLTATMLKTNGKWQFVSWHASAAPMGRNMAP